MITKISTKLALIVLLAGCTQKKVEQTMDVSDEIGINGIRVDSKHTTNSKHTKKQQPHTPKAPEKVKKIVWTKKANRTKGVDAVITTKIDGPVTSTTTVKDGTVRTTISPSVTPISQQTVSVESKPVVEQAVQSQPASTPTVVSQPVAQSPEVTVIQTTPAAPVITQPQTVTDAPSVTQTPPVTA